MKIRETAIEIVKKFFSNTSGDVVTLQEAFEAWGRRLENVEKNRGWMSNMLTHLKYHNLVKPLYDMKSGHRKLDKLQLTLEGKRAIGRFEENSNGETSQVTNGHNDISIEEIMKAVPKLQRDNPEFDIEFSVRAKMERK